MFQMSEPSFFKVPGLMASDTDSLSWRDTAAEGVSWILMAADARPAIEHSVAGNDEDLEGKRALDRQRNGAAVLIRMAPGRGYPAHRHLGAEDVLVLQGGYTDEWGEHVRGDFIRYPPGSEHAPRALGDPDAPVDEANLACVLFSSIAGGIELLNAPGSPA